MDESLLDFAENFRRSIGTPYISLDLLKDGESWKIAEFQVVAFGPVGKKLAANIFERFGDVWVKLPNVLSLEEEYVGAFIRFIDGA